MPKNNHIRLHKALCEFVKYIRNDIPIFENNFNFLHNKHISEMNSPVLNFLIPEMVGNRIGILILEIYGTWVIVQKLLKENYLPKLNENIQEYKDFNRIRNKHIGHLVEAKIFIKKERQWIENNYPTGNDLFRLCKFISNILVNKIEDLIEKGIVTKYVINKPLPIKLTIKDINSLILKT